MSGARFTRLPGSAREYIDNKTGIKVSRRQRDKIAAAEGMKKTLDISRRAKQRVAQSRYQSLVDDFIQKKGVTGKNAKRNVRNSAEFKNLVKELNKAGKASYRAKKAERNATTKKAKTRAHEISKRANNKLRKVLEEMGRRDGIPAWVPVGFSDAFRKGKLKNKQNLPTKWR